MDFYIPQTKKDIVLWLVSRYPRRIGFFSNMRKRQLLAIYINVRKQSEVAKCNNSSVKKNYQYQLAL